MATLWIRQYVTVARKGSVPAALEPGVDLTPVTFSGSVQSAAFAAGANFICIVGSAAFHYVVGADPTATTNALKIPADTPCYIGVAAGHKIAAIAAA